MARSKKTGKKKPIEQYAHRGRKRVNNPPVGLVTPDTDRPAGRKTYQYDPHLDPQLQWAGKAEHTSFEVPTVSLHVHERIDPRTIIEAVRKKNGQYGVSAPAGTPDYSSATEEQKKKYGYIGRTYIGPQISLFETQDENLPLRDAIEFYKHKKNWTNRLIAGDSLLVMNSMLEKEGLGGKVQMVYIDPPYGIKYGSNFQPFVSKRDVKDRRDDDLTAEPEMIKAFRDTWELGIHSYLTYLRDRLLLARELLTESGSCFVQISDENVHHVRELMDEVFGVENFVSLIAFRKKTMPLGAKYMDSMSDYLLWYAKDLSQLKYRAMYKIQDIEGDFHWKWYEDGSSTPKVMTKEENRNHKLLPKSSRIFRVVSMKAPGYSEQNDYPIEINGVSYNPPKGGSWITGKEGMQRLKKAGRLFIEGNTVTYKLYFDDFPLAKITNSWIDTVGAFNKVYVVQTNEEVIQRCMLMTTDPGDIVFDPTCGSGTTAYVAEQWGRRWISCDTSRVAVTLAKQRLMTALFDYFELARPDEGVGSGFKYKTVPHITLKSIANNEPPAEETLYDQPYVDKSRARVTGPFTVEAVPAPMVRSLSDITEEHPLPSGEGGRRPGEGKRQLDPKLRELSRKLRKGQTDAERLLWALLRDRRLAGFKFRRQHPVDPYVLDFYCHEARLAIELDGGQHNEPEKEASDKKRTAFLSEQGIRVLRFWNNEVLNETEAVLQTIQDALTPALSPREREFVADESVARSGETLRQDQWRDELLKAGIRGKGGQTIEFSRVEPLPGTRWLHADAETKGEVGSWENVWFDTGNKMSDGKTPRTVKANSEQEYQKYMAKSTWKPIGVEPPKRVVVSFGPEHAPLEQRQVALAIEEAQKLVPKPGIIVFASFQFDPEAAKDIDETDWPGVTLLKAQMNADLFTEDLRKKRTSNESFWLIGQPDVRVERIGKGEDRGKYRVEVCGFDYYNPRTGTIDSGGTEKIAMWMLDTDYDGRSLFARQVFFPMAGEKDGWSRLKKNLKAEIDEELIEAYRGTISLPFEPGENKRVAVKIVDDRGIESLKILEVG